MPYQQRRRRRYIVWEKLRPVILVLLGLASLAGLWWWLIQLGPNPVSANGDVVSNHAEDVEVASIRREVAALRDAFAAEGSSADVQLLEEAITKQREVVNKLEGNVGQAELRRLNELEAELASALAKDLNQRIGELDAQAATSREAGNLGAAEAAWMEALRLQAKVNRSGATSAMKNFVREGRLEQKLQELVAEPLAHEVREALVAARSASAAEEWSNALAALTTAQAVQLRINSDFPRSRHAGLAELDEIEREIESLDAAGVAAMVDEQEEAGDSAMAEDRFEVAVLAYEEARQTQMRLNREFSRSRFLSSSRVERLEVKRQTASSVPLMEALQLEGAAIDQMLKRRETTKAADRLEEVARRIEDVFTQLPKSDRLDPELRLRTSFLSAQRDRLVEVQDAVYDRLRPLPGVSELQLLRTELPQSLYLQIMRVNPSRNPGRAFPVDSVNWFDAMSFCERLGWVMGRPVRLPTEDEYRVAVGEATQIELDMDPDAERTKSDEMAALAPNAAGFFDLLGNVAEWLSPRPNQTGGWALVSGGSFLDQPEVLRKVPSIVTQRSERARHIGFRVLVEMATE